MALTLWAKNTFQLAALLFWPWPSSLSLAATPYQASATLPGFLPVVSQGKIDVEGEARLLTRTGCDQVSPWSSECARKIAVPPSE